MAGDDDKKQNEQGDEDSQSPSGTSTTSDPTPQDENTDPGVPVGPGKNP